jgi:predicted RNA-binding Zn-ribbon protein involved in translation (DUF1610 family)
MNIQMQQIRQTWKCPNCGNTIFEQNWYRQLPLQGNVVCQSCE